MHMSIQQSIKENIKQSMLARDQVRTEVLRGISAAFTNDLVSKNRKPTEELSDEEALAVIQKLAKQRKDSIEQFTAGDRMDLVAEESAQLAILETFLPEMMSREEIESVVRAKASELGVTDKSKAGQLTGTLMKDLRGKADGSIVKEIVDSLFA